MGRSQPHRARRPRRRWPPGARDDRAHRRGDRRGPGAVRRRRCWSRSTRRSSSPTRPATGPPRPRSTATSRASTPAPTRPTPASPSSATGPRGARLGARLKLDINPKSGRARRAIEVYPHPATVALFRLGRTLKYKNKPRPRPRGAPRRAAGADGPRRGPGRRDAPDACRLAGLVGAAERGRGGHPQVRAAGRRGPGRRRRGGVRRAVRRAGAGAHHDVRRPRDAATSSRPPCPRD